MTRLATFALACFALAVSMAGAWAQEAAPQVRVALVIGNSQYQSDRIPDLANPANDAQDIAGALKGFGFAVELKQDLDKTEMTAAMAAFAETAKQADVALFYYAGHGMQVDLRNYLAPIDAVYENQQDVINRSVALDALTGAVSGMKGSLLIFLDACQENPTGERDGLARIPVAQNQFVALAALPDARAADGTGRNSPFSAAFLSNAGAPGRNISDVMLQVRLDVLAATGSQVPWDNSSLTQEIVFQPGEDDGLPDETKLWQLAAKSKNALLLRSYVDQYPDGAHAEDAHVLLASAELPDGASQVRALSVGEDGIDEQFWTLANKKRQRQLVEAYLEQFPEGKHVEDARALINVLPDPNDPPPTFTCERLATHPSDETANFPGVSQARLKANAPLAIEACRQAHEAFPSIHKYTSFLARALYVDGQAEEAIGLYQEAAAAGNIRAMTTLGTLYETGGGVTPDLAVAADYYQKASAAGALDATVNLARMLAEGNGLPKDLPRAIQLLQDASAAGSKQASYNLGALALSDNGLPPVDAAKYFSLASDQGYVDAHFRAALLYESDQLGERDPKRAAEYLLRAVASDTGNMLRWIEDGEIVFGTDTMSEVQERLAALDYFNDTVDGDAGPKTLAALRVYRSGGASSG